MIKEISTFANSRPPALLEWGGRWSYSLYLVHYVVIVAFGHIAGYLQPFVRWPMLWIAILLASYLFYCVVESPGHLLARSFGRHLAHRRGPGGTTNGGVLA
jgi:peptidoglycan/LPS O-acetylase OafA/YrhL